MRLIKSLPELVMFLAIAFAALVNVAVWGGFVEGENARVGAAPAAELPAGNAPGAVDSPGVAAQAAESDENPDLPGLFVATQGRSHLDSAYPLDEPVPFCDGVSVTENCYFSNPPTSGPHLGVQRNATLPNGQLINIPPDPGVYDFEIPRESIPHLQEHAGVFLGYHCTTTECEEAIASITEIVTEELARGARVVMAPSTDFYPNTIALASWTRVDTFLPADFTEDRVRRFIETHSCRFDPEGFCVE